MPYGWFVAAAAAVAGIVVAPIVRRRNVTKFEADVARRRPTGSDGIVLGAEELRLQGTNANAVLVIHGFGDTPQSVKPLAVALQRAGYTVHAMLLPGHGRTLSEYKVARQADWIAAVHSAFNDLRATHEVVMVCGISMGAALTVILAEGHPEIPAIALLAPYLVMPRVMRVKSALARLFNFLLPYHANTGGSNSIHDSAARAETRGTGVVTGPLLAQLKSVAERASRALPSIRARALYLQSREDNRINAYDAVAQFARLGSPIKEQRWLTGCGHIITADYCRDEVAKQVIEWFAAQDSTAGRR